MQNSYALEKLHLPINFNEGYDSKETTEFIDDIINSAVSVAFRYAEYNWEYDSLASRRFCFAIGMCREIDDLKNAQTYERFVKNLRSTIPYSEISSQAAHVRNGSHLVKLLRFGDEVDQEFPLDYKDEYVASQIDESTDDLLKYLQFAFNDDGLFFLREGEHYKALDYLNFAYNIGSFRESNKMTIKMIALIKSLILDRSYKECKFQDSAIYTSSFLQKIIAGDRFINFAPLDLLDNSTLRLNDILR
jgi:hypothetical protein